MRECFKGETWFCQVDEIANLLEKILVNTPRYTITRSGTCIEAKSDYVHAVICKGENKQVGPIHAGSCIIDIKAVDESICSRIKILLMRGGG